MSSFNDLLTLPIAGQQKGKHESRLHVTTGVPATVGNVVPPLPKDATQRSDSTGNKDRSEGDPSGAQAPQGVDTGSGKKAAEAAVIALIDIGGIANYVNERREYIGASGIGDPCDAYQALSLRGFPSEKPEPKLMRIFRDGHRIESVVIADMRAGGISVEEINPATGKQWRYTAFGGLMSASLDGIVTIGGERMTLEIKSMNRAMFTKFKNSGLHVSHQHYVWQMIAGLGLARSCGESFERGMMVAYCKDTSEYHTEIIDFNNKVYGAMVDRVQLIISGNSSKRISTYANAYTCKSCFKKTACWEPSTLENLGCKQCAHAYVNEDNEWNCAMDNVFGVKCKSFATYRV